MINNRISVNLCLADIDTSTRVHIELPEQIIDFNTMP